MRSRFWIVMAGCLCIAGAVSAFSGADVPGLRRVVRRSTPCGWHVKAPKHYKHVIWITFENASYHTIVRGRLTPYMTKLARECGNALKMGGEAHPSAPNYVAMASGGVHGVRGDPAPHHAIAANNIYHEVRASGRQWRHYASRMPRNCDMQDSRNHYYTAHHEQPVYFSDIYRACLKWDVPLDRGEKGPLCQSRRVSGCPDTRHGALAKALDDNRLAAFVSIGPADDGGNSRLGGEVDPKIGDEFLQRWMAKITSSRAYRSGSTAIFVTWDENRTFNGSATNPPIPTLIVAPSIPAETTSKIRFNHYSMLRATESMLGLPMLGAAKTAHHMRSAFHF